MKIFRRILSVPHNIVMDLNNVMNMDSGFETQMYCSYDFEFEPHPSPSNVRATYALYSTMEYLEPST